MTSASLRVCYFGAYDPTYPRNLVLRRGLEQQGAQVVQCQVSPKLPYREWIRQLSGKFPSVASDIDVVLLAEFNANLTWLAAWLARRYHKRLVFDAFVSVYDSAVHDRGSARPYTPQALRYWLMDWFALHSAGRLLTDTSAHVAYFISQYRAKPVRFQVVPVGAPREWFETPSNPQDTQNLLVQFYGTYIPLHGVQTILDAAHILRDHREVRFELVGRGQTYSEMQAYADELGLTNVAFRDSVPHDVLPDLVARADISLGIFGTTGKAARVIPNKVYQTLALGKPLITADTPALREGFSPGEHLIGVPAGDAAALAEAISTLAADPDLRQRIALAGRARMQAAFTEAKIAAKLVEALV